MELAPTLAQRVNQLRDFRNMTIRDLSKSSRFSVQRIEDIEAGIETWLSASDRQLLAKALSVEPVLLHEVETRSIAGHHVKESHMLDKATSIQIGDAILNGARELECPDCGSTLRCSVQQSLDIEGKPVYLPKAFCFKCPFLLR